MSGDEVVDIVLKRCLGDVEGQVGGLLFGLLESSQEMIDLSGVSVVASERLAMQTGEIWERGEAIGSNIPSTKIDHGGVFRDTGGNFGSVGIKESDLIMGLVELWDRDDVVPDEEALVVVEQLVWQGWLLVGLVNGCEGTLQATDDTMAKLASTDVFDIARGDELGLSSHDVGVGEVRFV